MSTHGLPRPTAADLINARQRLGLSQGEVASIVGAGDHKTVGRWERGGAVSNRHLAALVAWLRSTGWAPHDGPAPPTEPTAADALELAGRAVEIEELMSYALHRQRLLRQAMQAAGLSLPAGPRTAAGSGAG
jgi:transcriptional regulator with XRE-family HTH domain